MLVYVSSVKKTPTKPYTVAIVKLLLDLIWSTLLQITSQISVSCDRVQFPLSPKNSFTQDQTGKVDFFFYFSNYDRVN